MQVFKSRIFDSCMVQNQLQNVVDACLKPLRLSSSALHAGFKRLKLYN